MSKFYDYFCCKKAVTLVLCLVLSAGCIQKNNQTQESMTQAQMLLDQRRFDSAITKYEEIVSNNPTNEEAKIKLFHAYAGAGGFEALTLMDVAKAAENKIVEIENREKNKIEKKLKQKGIEAVDNTLEQLEQILARVPVLNSKQRENLNKAINLYQELGLKLETAGKYNNFKWGTLHAFRLAVNLKEIVAGLKLAKDENQNYDFKLIEKVLLSHGKEVGTDFYQVTKLYSHSYEKFRLIHEKIENLIGQTIKNPAFKFKINDLANSEKEFYESFVRENAVAFSMIMSQYVEAYKNAMGQLVTNGAKALPPKKDIEETRIRLQALIKLALAKFTVENPDSEIALKGLFNSSTKQELFRALIDSINSENTLPLKELLLSKNSKLQSVTVYALLLLNEIQDDGVADEIRNEVNALKLKIDQEILKEELEKNKLAIQLAEETSKEQTALLNEKDRILLETHSANLNERILDIEEYLKTPIEELNGALMTKVPDEDQEQIDRILKSIFKN